METLVIAGGRVLRPDGRVTEDDVLVDADAGTVEAVGPDLDGDRRLDAEGGVVMPGLVNAHTHVAMTLLRGYADDKALDAWLQEDIWPAEAALTPDDIEAGAARGLLEMIRTGTTAFADMYFEMDRVAAAVDRAGLRARLGPGVVTVGKDDGDATAAAAPDAFLEGRVLETVVEELPDPATLFVSNSMPVRDLDRFAAPSTTSVTVLGNRGASGIDGIVSTALGAGSATTDDLTLVTGDIALYHDANGLLALDRCDVDATIVAINNDGGGIFHKLPVEAFDPPFTEQFKTPHGVDFEPLSELYGVDFARIDARGEAAGGETRGGDGAAANALAPDEATAALRDALATARSEPGSHLIEVRTDAEASHRAREALRERVVERVREA